MSLNNIFFRLTTKEKMLFARHMEVMIKSGMQILPALEILKNQTKSKSFNKILDQLIQDVRSGHFLSVGLARYPHVFGDFFINLVRVGETSGTLAENLQYLTEELKKKDELTKKIRGAMVYPIVIMVATLGITSLMTFFIFPKILPVLKSLNVTLPAVTVAFIFVSEFLLKYWIWLLVAIVAFVVGFMIAIRVPTIKYWWHKLILKIPFVGNMSRTINIISLSRTVGLLLKANLQIIEALEITGSTLSNLIYRDKVKQIVEGVKKGDPMSKYFVEDPNLFPPIFSQMVVVGENTGKLDESILYLADYYETELDEITKSMASFLEPALILVMGLVVIFVALAIITPIYAITQNLGR